MSIENIKQGSVITDKVSLLLRNGENEKALDLLGQNYGPLARNAMEKVMKYSNLSQDEMVRVFGKISDILENVADKISRHERLNEKKEKRLQPGNRPKTRQNLPPYRQKLWNAGKNLKTGCAGWKNRSKSWLKSVVSWKNSAALRKMPANAVK